MKTKLLFPCSFLICMFSIANVQAVSTLDDIGFTDLSLELGADLPDGSSITVTQVEAPNAGPPGACIPDVDNTEFSLIIFDDKTELVADCTGAVSGHANSVAQKFYGSVSSSSTAIANVALFEANNWLVAGFLNTSVGGLLTNSVDISSTRLVNHSWAGSAPGWDAEILRRTDFSIEVDEFIQVIGVHTNTVANPLLSSSFNAIVAGLSAGTGTTGTATIVTNLIDDITYVSGRAKPDIVSPEGTGSASAPRISSAAVLLMDHAHVSNAALSNGFMTNRNGDTIYNAERSETIKALLMAGADRATVGNTNTVDITDYRSADNQTTNGLDTRFGAGQVNSYNSHHILAEGEQDSEEDGGSVFANVGFDYDPSFGGLNGSNPTATYSFTTSAVGGQKIKASLVWNLDVLTTSTDNFYNLDLQLIDVATGVVVSSTSIIDNTENIWWDLTSNKNYQLKVIAGSGQGAFEWDYALAWQIVVPGITVVESGGSTITAEDGATDIFTIVLDSPPTGDVVIDIASSYINEATVSPASVTFTSANWSTLQTVTVTGVDDALDDGDKNYDIDFAVSSSIDLNYDGLVLTSIAASNTDDDATFSFIDQTAVGLSTIVTSNAAVVTGVSASLPILISVGEYSINGDPYTSVDGFVNNNDNVTVKITSSAVGLTPVNVVLTIGGSSDTFTVTTEIDTDTDGVGDSTDAFPSNIAASVDGDNDGLPDAWNASCDATCQSNSGLVLDTSLDDTDNDGVVNSSDAFPTDPTETTDSDGDGVGDNADAFPNDATETVDTDGDGVGDNADVFPNDATETVDTDGDGVGDNTDAFPSDATETTDADSDGVGDNADAFPANIAASVDTDNDGLPDEWNASCDVTCQTSSGLTLDTTSVDSSGGGGSLGLMWLMLPFFITVARRRSLFYLSK